MVNCLNCSFVNALCPGQQFFSHVRMISCLPGLNKYYAEENVCGLMSQSTAMIMWRGCASNQRRFKLKSNTLPLSQHTVKSQLQNPELWNNPKSLLQVETTVKPVLTCHSKIDKTKVLKTNASLMKVESIAECSPGAFCNTFDLHKGEHSAILLTCIKR